MKGELLHIPHVLFGMNKPSVLQLPGLKLANLSGYVGQQRIQLAKPNTFFSCRAGEQTSF